MMTEQTVRVPSQAPPIDGQSEAEQIKMQVLGRCFMFLPALAGISYGIAWAGGLAAWPSNLTIDATKREIVSLYAAHQSEATAQYLVVEGIAGVLLGMVLFYCIWRIRRCERTWTSRAAVAGGVAVAVSLLQCLLGLLLVSAASKGYLGRSGDIYQLINRLDGVKQLLLGACVVMLGILLRTTSNYPLWLGRTSVITGIALVPSGLAYLLLWNVLAGTTFASLPLLILWVAGTGIWFGAESQRGPDGAFAHSESPSPLVDLPHSFGRLGRTTARAGARPQPRRKRGSLWWSRLPRCYGGAFSSVRAPANKGLPHRPRGTGV
jgi:hypothetical protein